jgi:hypothetical protein
LSAASVAVLVALAAKAGSAQTPTVLVAGSELVYESGGTAGAPWRVEFVERDLSLGGRTGCLRVRFAAGGPRAGADERVTCAADGMLYAWDTAGRAWRASRPIAPGRTLELPTRTGFSKYSTALARDETISGVSLTAVETTVLTVDSAGRAVRRLRELYAPAIGTATWGVFEMPDPQAEGGWRVVQEFRLVAIRRPGG